jgi:hypothetical protein
VYSKNIVLKPTILSITTAVAIYTDPKTSIELSIFEIKGGDAEVNAIEWEGKERPFCVFSYHSYNCADLTPYKRH